MQDGCAYMHACTIHYCDTATSLNFTAAAAAAAVALMPLMIVCSCHDYYRRQLPVMLQSCQCPAKHSKRAHKVHHSTLAYSNSSDDIVQPPCAMQLTCTASERLFGSCGPLTLATPRCKACHAVPVRIDQSHHAAALRLLIKPQRSFRSAISATLPPCKNTGIKRDLTLPEQLRIAVQESPPSSPAISVAGPPSYLRYHLLLKRIVDIIDPVAIQLECERNIGNSQISEHCCNAGLNEREALQRQMQMQQDAYQAEMAKLDGFWQQQTDAIADIDPQTADFKAMELPLARVKKIMRLEDDLKVVAHALHANLVRAYT
eukprot:7025-Heterococcus_DN1.PRE.1